MAKKQDDQPSKKDDASPAAPPSPAARKSRLGRGLSSLMQLDDEQAQPAEPAKATPVMRETPVAAPPPEVDDGSPRLLDVPIGDVGVNPHQPRKSFGPVALAELAASIKVNGIIQPLTVRPLPNGKYELIAGERRLRAAKLAELEMVPCVVRHVERAEQAEMALVENIQREDLNPIDRAEAYRELQRELSLNQSELAERLGEERSQVNHHLRLLDLPARVLDMVRDGSLPLGHAKVIAGVEGEEDQVRLAELAVEQHLSVRHVERLAAGNSEERRQKTKEAQAKATYLDRLAETLTKAVGTPCAVKAAGQGGYKLTLTLKSADQFDRLMERLSVKADE